MCVCTSRHLQGYTFRIQTYTSIHTFHNLVQSYFSYINWLLYVTGLSNFLRWTYCVKLCTFSLQFNNRPSKPLRSLNWRNYISQASGIPDSLTFSYTLLYVHEIDVKKWLFFVLQSCKLHLASNYFWTILKANPRVYWFLAKVKYSRDKCQSAKTL